MPAPATKMVREAATGRSGGLVFHDAFGRTGFPGLEVGGVAIKSRAIGADDFVVVAEIEENMGMIERRIGAHAHELLRADLNDRNAGIVVKVRNDMVGHNIHLEWQRGGRNQQDATGMLRTIRAGIVDSQSHGRSFANANSTQSCRPREALLSSGPLCLKNGRPFWGSAKTLGFFRMRRSRIGSALAG